MRHRVSCHPIDPRGRIHLFDAVGASQLSSRDLAGCRLLVRAQCGKRENASRANSQHSAYDALLPHAQTNEGVLVALFLQKFHHRHVVIKSRGGSYDLVEVSRNRNHLFQRLFQFSGSPIIVIGKNQSSPGAQSLQLLGFQTRSTLQFDIN